MPCPKLEVQLFMIILVFFLVFVMFKSIKVFQNDENQLLSIRLAFITIVLSYMRKTSIGLMYLHIFYSNFNFKFFHNHNFFFRLKLDYPKSLLERFAYILEFFDLGIINIIIFPTCEFNVNYKIMWLTSIFCPIIFMFFLIIFSFFKYYKTSRVLFIAISIT